MKLLITLTISMVIAINQVMASETNTLPERVIWNHRAIPLLIPTSQERSVHFPEPVRYWMPDHLSLKLTALSANGVLYLQAHQPFDKTRIRIQGMESQQLYLLDVQSNTDEGSLAKLIILNPDPQPENNTTAKRGRQDWYERLNRHAAQQLYAPERLIEADASIRRVRIDNKPLTGLLRDSRLTAQAIASWTGGDYFVTAIQITNTTDHSIELTLEDNQQVINHTNQTIHIPSAIRGQWLTASVQHNHLTPQKQQASSTTLYLISKRPFFELWEGDYGA